MEHFSVVRNFIGGNYKKLSSFQKFGEKLYKCASRLQYQTCLKKIICWIFYYMKFTKQNQVVNILKKRNLETSTTTKFLNSVESESLIDFFIVGIEWKLLSYRKCDCYDFLLEWVIGYILLGLLPRQ